MYHKNISESYHQKVDQNINKTQLNLKHNHTIVPALKIEEEQEKEETENLTELINTVYDQISQACDTKNLKWEAELDIGLKQGVKFHVKLKITPKE